MLILSKHYLPTVLLWLTNAVKPFVETGARFNHSTAKPSTTAELRRAEVVAASDYPNIVTVEH